MNKKIEKLNKVFMNSWKRFELKDQFGFNEMLDKFMRSQLSDGEYRIWKTESAIGYTDCMFLDKVFVPDMEDRQRDLNMQERLREESAEPEIFGEKVVGEWWNGIATDHDQLGYSPFEL